MPKVIQEAYEQINFLSQNKCYECIELLRPLHSWQSSVHNVMHAIKVSLNIQTLSRLLMCVFISDLDISKKLSICKLNSLQ